MMAQGDFTKVEATQTRKAVAEMYQAIPELKRGRFIGHVNEIFMFLEAARKAAPSEKAAEPASTS